MTAPAPPRAARPRDRRVASPPCSGGPFAPRAPALRQRACSLATLAIDGGRGPDPARPARGSALVLVLLVAALLTLFVLALAATGDGELRSGRAFADNAGALADAESGVQEVLWRLNLAAGTRIAVNGLTGYEPRIDPDPLNLLGNGVDDDGDGAVDNRDEIVLARDWVLRMTLTTTAVNPGAPYVVADGSPSSGPPWGPKVVVPTVQPSASWRPYTTAGAADPDVLTLRLKLDTDLPGLAAVPHPSPQVVFWDSTLPGNGVGHATSLVGYGGDGDAGNDSPYNLLWAGGGGKRRPTGSPVLLLRVTGRGVRGGRTVARRAIEVELSRPGTAGAGRHFLCACDHLDVKSATFLADSYRSSQGSYGSGPIGAGAGVGANQKCDLKGAIKGSATCGDDIKGAQALTGDATSGKTIAGTPGGSSRPNTVPVPRPCACEPADLAAVDAAVAAAKLVNDNAALPLACRGPALKLTGAATCTLPPGTYHYDKIELDDTARLLSAATPEAPARILLADQLKAQRQSLVNAGRPGSLLITGRGSGDTVVIEDDADVAAVITAPYGKLKLNQRAEFFGAATVKNFESGGDGRAHADEDVVGGSSAALGPWQVIAWRETN